MSDLNLLLRSFDKYETRERELVHHFFLKCCVEGRLNEINRILGMKLVSKQTAMEGLLSACENEQLEVGEWLLNAVLNEFPVLMTKAVESNNVEFVRMVSMKYKQLLFDDYMEMWLIRAQVRGFGEIEALLRFHYACNVPIKFEPTILIK
jgi:hypothetical protein